MSRVSLAREYAEKLDADDPLAGFRDRFTLDDPSLVYLNGNSLGPLPRATLRRLEEVIRQEWGTALARSWDHWVDLPGRAGDAVGRLTGAAPGEFFGVGLWEGIGAVITGFALWREGTLVPSRA